jgi:hypothetical protein
VPVEEDAQLEPSGVEKILGGQLSCLPQLAPLTQAISKPKRRAIAENPKEFIDLLYKAVSTFNQSNRLG